MSVPRGIGIVWVVKVKKGELVRKKEQREKDGGREGK